MTTDPFYTIASEGPEGVFEVTLNPDHALFDGHFPGHPVLPGVCSLMIVRACSERVAGMPLRYAVVRESKFLAAILPAGAPLAVHVRLAEKAGGYALEAAVCRKKSIMVKLKAELTLDE